MNKLLLFGVLGLFFISGISFLNDNLKDTNSNIETLSYEDQLIELDRINKKLLVDPINLADPETRRVSEQAGELSTEQSVHNGENRW